MSDHIANVNPAGVTEVANFEEISAWVYPQMRYGESGMLTSVVNPIVRSETIRRIYLFIRIV